MALYPLIALLFGGQQPVDNPYPYPYIDQSSCEPLAGIYNAQVVPWITYVGDVGWGLPDNLTVFDGQVFNDGSEAWRLRGSRRFTEYISYFFDKETGTDSNGKHFGFHHVCMMIRGVSPAVWEFETAGAFIQEQYRRMVLIWVLHH